MEIFGREIGPQTAPYFIAEIGANHDGELQRALRLIELAADCGADAVKFQHFEAPSIVSRRGFGELNGKLAHQAGWEKDVYEVYEDAAIPREWTDHLSSYCHDHGLAFITTPYSLELADYVEPYVDAYKIGSGDITYHELIRHVAGKGKAVLLATGASTAAEVEYAIRLILPAVPLVLMQCNTDYTGNPALSELSLGVIGEWCESIYLDAVGLSDHTRTPQTVCTAAALGASVFEKHFTDDPHRKGPDHSFAITPFEWRQMVKDVANVRESLGTPLKRVGENEEEARIVQRRALRYVITMPFGDTLARGDVVATRPCPAGALEPFQVEAVIGRTLRRDVEADALVRTEDFE